MKKPITAALAVFLFGSTLLSGCFVVPPFWWEPFPDGRWEGRHHERRGALTPQEQQRQQDDLARKGEAGNRRG